MRALAVVCRTCRCHHRSVDHVVSVGDLQSPYLPPPPPRPRGHNTHTRTHLHRFPFLAYLRA